MSQQECVEEYTVFQKYGNEQKKKVRSYLEYGIKEGEEIKKIHNLVTRFNKTLNQIK